MIGRGTASVRAALASSRAIGQQ
jgi:hypothetical protein